MMGLTVGAREKSKLSKMYLIICYGRKNLMLEMRPGLRNITETELLLPKTRRGRRKDLIRSSTGRKAVTILIKHGPDYL